MSLTEEQKAKIKEQKAKKLKALKDKQTIKK